MDLLKPMSALEAANWKDTGPKGKLLRVFRSAIFYFVLMLLARIGLDWLLEEQLVFEVSILIVLALLGLAFGLGDWWVNESRYQTHLFKKKAQNGPID